jgi:hypothetical protein
MRRNQSFGSYKSFSSLLDLEKSAANNPEAEKPHYDSDPEKSQEVENSYSSYSGTESGSESDVDSDSEFELEPELKLEPKRSFLELKTLILENILKARQHLVHLLRLYDNAFSSYEITTPAKIRAIMGDCHDDIDAKHYLVSLWTIYNNASASINAACHESPWAYKQVDENKNVRTFNYYTELEKVLTRMNELSYPLEKRKAVRIEKEVCMQIAIAYVNKALNLLCEFNSRVAECAVKRRFFEVGATRGITTEIGHGSTRGNSI